MCHVCYALLPWIKPFEAHLKQQGYSCKKRSCLSRSTHLLSSVYHDQSKFDRNLVQSICFIWFTRKYYHRFLRGWTIKVLYIYIEYLYSRWLTLEAAGTSIYGVRHWLQLLMTHTPCHWLQLSDQTVLKNHFVGKLFAYSGIMEAFKAKYLTIRHLWGPKE